MKCPYPLIAAYLMLLALSGSTHATEAMHARVMAVNVVDWEFAAGRGVEAFLLLDNGWEIRFAHPLVGALHAGVTVALEFSPTHGLDRSIPVVCRLETPGAVLHALPSRECPRSSGR